MQNVNSPVYQAKTTTEDRSKMARAVTLPILAFFLSIISVAKMQNFGRLWMSPLIGLMWSFGAATAFHIPQQRREVINQTVTNVCIYCGAILGLRQLLALAEGVSPAMLEATFQQSVTTAGTNTALGFMKNSLYIVSFMYPLSFIAMQAKRWFMFRKKTDKEKAMRRYRGIR